MPQLTKHDIALETVTNLQQYIQSEPIHNNGLCWWLSNLKDYDNDKKRHKDRAAQEIFAYSLVAQAQLSPDCPEFYGTYVSHINGFCAKRAEFAQFLIDLIMAEELVPTQADWTCGWEYVGPACTPS